MNRANYSDDIDDWQLIRWRGAVTKAIKGRRGQAFLRELLEALDAMPVKELIADELVDASGAVCAIGSLARKRGCLSQFATIDPEDSAAIADSVGIADALARELMYVNDEVWGKDAAWRFRSVRAWVASQILP